MCNGELLRKERGEVLFQFMLRLWVSEIPKDPLKAAHNGLARELM